MHETWRYFIGVFEHVVYGRILMTKLWRYPLPPWHAQRAGSKHVGHSFEFYHSGTIGSTLFRDHMLVTLDVLVVVLYGCLV